LHTNFSTRRRWVQEVFTVPAPDDCRLRHSPREGRQGHSVHGYYVNCASILT